MKNRYARLFISIPEHLYKSDLLWATRQNADFVILTQ